jgi:hypothetical protein
MEDYHILKKKAIGDGARHRLAAKAAAGARHQMKALNWSKFLTGLAKEVPDNKDIYMV